MDDELGEQGQSDKTSPKTEDESVSLSPDDPSGNLDSDDLVAFLAPIARLVNDLTDEQWSDLDGVLTTEIDLQGVETSTGIVSLISKLNYVFDLGMTDAAGHGFLQLLGYPFATETWGRVFEAQAADKVRSLRRRFGVRAYEITRQRSMGSRNWAELTIELVVDPELPDAQKRVLIVFGRVDGQRFTLEMPTVSYVRLITRYMAALVGIPEDHFADADHEDLKDLMTVLEAARETTSNLVDARDRGPGESRDDPR